MSPKLQAAFLLFANCLAAEPATAQSPIGELRSGWAYLPGEGIDSVPGIYHDRVSGACVSMDLAWPSVVSPTPAQGSEVGTAHGVRYHRRYEKSKQCRGGDALEVSVFPAGEEATSLIWHFSVDVCNAEQRKRVDDLLFGTARIGLPMQRPRYRAELPTVAEVTGFTPGTPVADVVAKLGDPGFSSCEQRGGFTVGYAAKHGESYREWNVRFDAQQGFVSAKRTHPGY